MTLVARLIGVAAIVGFLVVLGIAVNAAESKNSFVKAIAADRRPAAPQFDLPALSGSTRTALKDLRGSVVVVNFWASWCAACEDEAPLLADLAREQEAQGVVFVGVDEEDVLDDARAFVARYGLRYRQLRDEAKKVKRAWAVGAYPETFVLDRAGRAVAWFPGVITPDGLRAAIAKART